MPLRTAFEADGFRAIIRLAPQLYTLQRVVQHARSMYCSTAQLHVSYVGQIMIRSSRSDHLDQIMLRSCSDHDLPGLDRTDQWLETYLVLGSMHTCGLTNRLIGRTCNILTLHTTAVQVPPCCAARMYACGTTIPMYRMYVCAVILQ